MSQPLTTEDQIKKLERRILNQRSEIKNRLIQIYGMERELAWLRGVRKRVRTALELDHETLKSGISDPADAAKLLMSELKRRRAAPENGAASSPQPTRDANEKELMEGGTKQ